MKNKRWIYLVSVFALWILPLFSSDSSEAAMCAFRNPDKDIYVLFPKATGYRSVIKMLDKKAQEKVEEYLGQKIDFDEVGEHKFYLILKDKDVIGIIRPHAERGKYGIVEMVWAFTPDGRIRDYKIQRSRERNTDKVKCEEFRGQFKGKTLKVKFTETGSKKINSTVFKVLEKSERISSIVAYSAKKNLFLYKYFFPEYNKNVEEIPKEKSTQKSEGKRNSK